jgi:hypothetical protein
MIQKSKRGRFSFPIVRHRVRKKLRSKHKKTIKLSEVDKIWKDYVEYAIIKPLLDGRRVEIKSMTIEVVGTRLGKEKGLATLLVKGFNVGRSGVIKDATDWGAHRQGVKYKIVLTDTEYKRGSLVFRSNPKLARRVHETLKNTVTYFRIKP